MSLTERATEYWQSLHKKKRWYRRIISYVGDMLYLAKDIILEVVIPFLVTIIVILGSLSILFIIVMFLSGLL